MTQYEDITGYVPAERLPQPLRGLVPSSGITVEAANALRTPDDIRQAAARLTVWRAHAQDQPFPAQWQ